MKPHSRHAEQMLLGSILMNNEWMEIAANEIGPGSFSRVANGTIFLAMYELHKQGAKIDFLTVEDMLGDKLAEAGGAEYINSLTDAVPADVTEKRIRRAINAIQTANIGRTIILMVERLTERTVAIDDEDTTLH